MADYVLQIFDADGSIGAMLEFQCAHDLEATTVALGAESPFGHLLWREDAFIGWFTPALTPPPSGLKIVGSGFSGD